MIYLALGANLGDRKQNLSAAQQMLGEQGFSTLRCSPVVESPAWLPAKSQPQWNRPYLNVVIEGEFAQSPEELLKRLKDIEQALGRDLAAPRWSPRPIDIDILVWEGEQRQSAELTLPHPHCLKRPFVMTPLAHLNAGLQIAGQSVYQHHLKLRPIPLWMGIVNLTPDSFSDGGVSDDAAALEQKLVAWLDAGIHILDVGAESTRPNAQPLSPQAEWQRLEPALKMIQRLIEPLAFAPLISVDTRHEEVAQKALDYGMNWLNDVTGLADSALQRLVAEHDLDVVAMHSVSVPVDPKAQLEMDTDPVEHIAAWVHARQAQWQAAGISNSRILIDPGIGFGKSSLQNQALLQNCQALRSLGQRLLVGHSRKSFMNDFTGSDYSDRDIETLGVSMALCQQGVDVIRVHEPLSHLRAYRAWAHVSG